MRNGERVRVACGATGRYLGFGLALVVSAQDNDLFIDRVRTDGMEPHPTLPVPSDEAVDVATMTLNWAGRRGWEA